MTQQTPISPSDRGRLRRLIFAYVWLVLKNVIGWLLILAAWPIGVAIPGPGGLPLFIIGFAMVTFPGKRNLTARVLRGKPVHRDSRAYRVMLATLAILIPAGCLAWWHQRWWPYVTGGTVSMALIIGYLSSVMLIWVGGYRGYTLINVLLSLIARGRRKVRPWLRARGLDLLPPRRRRRLRHHVAYCHEPDVGILEIHERHRERMDRIWKRSRVWLIRLMRFAFICAVFAWMLRPVYRKWDQVRGPILATNWWAFAAAALMFSFFLFVFRALAWRHILAGLGHRLPVAPAVRIWSFSELARYLPGVIWQVVGRVFLSRPYGVSGAVSSASQLLELSIFMLANIAVAMACLLGAGLRLIPPDQRKWIFIAMAFVPALLILLHPPVFYGLLNRLLTRLKKQPITQQLPKRQLLLVLAWTVVGLLWQSLAVWLLTRSTLHLPITKWYVLAGAYCLAWTIGFSVGFLSPGGMGVREMVFITTMRFVLPQEWVARNLKLDDPSLFLAFLGFLGVLLRLWAIAGELTMAGLTYIADYRGATGRPDAPGRVGNSPPPADSTTASSPPAGSLAADGGLDRPS